MGLYLPSLPHTPSHRPLVCASLNSGVLHEWVKLVIADTDVIAAVFEPWAFMRSGELAWAASSRANGLVTLFDELRTLSQYPFFLALDFEANTAARKARSRNLVPPPEQDVIFPPESEPHSEVLDALHVAVSKLESYFARQGVLKTSEPGNDRLHKEAAVLVRGELCTALSRVLLHGIKYVLCHTNPEPGVSCAACAKAPHPLAPPRTLLIYPCSSVPRAYSINTSSSIWDFVRETCRRAQANAPASPTLAIITNFVDTIDAEPAFGDDDNVKLRTFVCAALNNKRLHEWMAALLQERDAVASCYEPHALVCSPDLVHELTMAMTPLQLYTFTLSLDYEYRPSTRSSSPQRRWLSEAERLVTSAELSLTPPMRATEGVISYS